MATSGKVALGEDCPGSPPCEMKSAMPVYDRRLSHRRRQTVNLGWFRQVEQLLGRRPATLKIAPPSLVQEFAPESASPEVDPLNAASVWFLDNPRKFEPRPRRQHVLGRVPTKVKA